jgi:major vault protein
VLRKPGEQWLKKGPCEYIPNVATVVVERRQLIPLDEGEGIYVRNINTGQIEAIVGRSHLVQEAEVLWGKELPAAVEEVLLASNKGVREPHRVVSYRAPYNTAVRVYDYVAGKSRIVFGPDLVMLEPNEQFTLIELSGGTPKREGVIKVRSPALRAHRC